MAGENSTVLVTGFGPFHHHRVNASWVAVQELAGIGVKHKGEEVHLEIREIPVVYEVVSKEIPKVWEEVKPKLCVHVGVSPYDCIKIEKNGSNIGYFLPDVASQTPANGVCVKGSSDVITTIFNVEEVCKNVSLKQPDVRFETSEDAGQYLCDFIYYTSLQLQKAPVIFVHVPPLDNPYSQDQLAHGLKNIIETLLEHMGQL